MKRSGNLTGPGLAAVTSVGFRAVAAFSLLCLLTSCKSKSRNEVATPSANAVQLSFTYGSEKEKWNNEVTDIFNRKTPRPSAENPFFVHAIRMGSGEAIDEFFEGRRQPDLITPASAAFIRLGNAQSQSKYGKDLIGST